VLLEQIAGRLRGGGHQVGGGGGGGFSGLPHNNTGNKPYDVGGNIGRLTGNRRFHPSPRERRFTGHRMSHRLSTTSSIGVSERGGKYTKFGRDSLFDKAMRERKVTMTGGRREVEEEGEKGKHFDMPPPAPRLGAGGGMGRQKSIDEEDDGDVML